MREVILNQPEQITKSLETNKAVRVEGDYDSLILCGMGGSGHPGDLLNALGITTRPLYVHRNYDLPLSYLRQLGLSRPLIITSSYSGNTEEALSSYQAAQQAKLTILVSTSGGTLAQWAKRDGAPLTRIQFTNMQPRHTLFAAFTGIYIALANSQLATNITDDLIRVAKVLQEKTPALEAPAQALAKQMQGKIPVLYASDNLGFAAKHFKIQTNENAKYPAYWNTFPELNHNELLGFSKLKETKNANQFFVLMLHDPKDHPRIAARMQVTSDLYSNWGVTVEHFTVEGKTLVEKIFLAVTLGLWTSYYLALANGLDPIPVEGVEDFKAKLKEVAGEN